MSFIALPQHTPECGSRRLEPDLWQGACTCGAFARWAEEVAIACRNASPQTKRVFKMALNSAFGPLTSRVR